MVTHCGGTVTIRALKYKGHLGTVEKSKGVLFFVVIAIKRGWVVGGVAIALHSQPFVKKT